MADNRADLINQLASSMGVGDFSLTKYEESRYDPLTGTLFCEGYVISKSLLDEAIKHFTMLRNRCGDNPESARMKMIYQAAIEAIKLMQAQKENK